jgi:hypothetical protein
MANSMLAAVHDAATGGAEPDETTARTAAREAASMIASTAAAARDEGRSERRKDGAAAARADAAAIAEMCNAAGVPAMATALIREGVSADAARARIDGAKEIKAAVELARKSCPAIDAGQADKYVAAGLAIEAVRADLFTRMAALQSPEINANHQAGPGKAVAAAWDKAVAKVNGRIPGRAAA